MTRRRYSSTAAATTLSSSITNSQTSLVVGSVTGFPGAYPYELILELGTASEEAVLVTAGGGTTLTVTRGFDGTTGLAHAGGATVIHGTSAIDLDEANSHVNEVTTAHGLTLANLVQLVAVQVLTNKDMTASTNSFAAANIVPVGLLSPFAGSAAPSGWLLCDGSSQLRATYAALFTAIGTTYGSVDGTHFNVPDMRGRVPAGLDNLGGSDAGRLTSANTLGTAVGEEKHTLITAEMPSHTHPPLTGSFAETNGSASFTPSGALVNSIINFADTTTGATGGGTAHNVMQPTLTLSYIIKV